MSLSRRASLAVERMVFECCAISNSTLPLIASIRCPVAVRDVSNASFDALTGSGMPRPPNLTGKANICLSAFVNFSSPSGRSNANL